MRTQRGGCPTRPIVRGRAHRIDHTRSETFTRIPVSTARLTTTPSPIQDLARRSSLPHRTRSRMLNTLPLIHDRVLPVFHFSLSVPPTASLRNPAAVRPVSPSPAPLVVVPKDVQACCPPEHSAFRASARYVTERSTNSSARLMPSGYGCSFTTVVERKVPSSTVPGSSSALSPSCTTPFAPTHLHAGKPACFRHHACLRKPSLTFPPALNVGRPGPRWPARCAAVPRAAHPARLLNQSMTLHIIAPICLPPYFDGTAPYAVVPTGRDDRDGH